MAAQGTDVVPINRAGVNYKLPLSDIAGLVAGGAPAGASTQIQYNNNGASDGASKILVDATEHLVIDEYQEIIAVNNTPAVPIAGRIRQFARAIGGRVMAAFVGPSGQRYTLQPHAGFNRIAKWQAIGNANTLTVEGATTLTATGNATTANSAITNKYTQIRRLEYLVTTSANNAIAGWRGAAALWFRGATAGAGGFNFICQFGPSTGVATTTNRCFVGMAAATNAPTDVQPSTLVNMIGVAWDAADANIQIMHNAATGTATKVDLGASFPVPTVDRTKVYELCLFCAPNDTSIGYTVTDLTNNAQISGEISTNLPVNTTFLAPRGWLSSGGTNSVIGVALMQLYIETDV